MMIKITIEKNGTKVQIESDQDVSALVAAVTNALNSPQWVYTYPYHGYNPVWHLNPGAQPYISTPQITWTTASDGSLTGLTSSGFTINLDGISDEKLVEFRDSWSSLVASH